MDFLSDEVIHFPVTLTRNHQPVVPDGDVSFTLIDSSGNKLITDELVTPIGSAGFQLVLEIPAEHNKIDPSRQFERRTVLLKYSQNGVIYVDKHFYRLVPLLPHSVTPDQVRSYLGVNTSELPDSDINIFDSYLEIENLVGSPAVLQQALTAGDRREVAANTMIRMHAALQVIPSLKQRLAQEERSGAKMFARATIRDFDELRRDAEMRLQASLEELRSGLPTTMALVVTTQEIDPITAGG